MVVLDEYKFKLGELTKTLEQANAQMRPDELKTELKGLEDQMSAADFWNDVDAANKVTQRVKSIKNKLDRLDKLNGSREDVLTNRQPMVATVPPRSRSARRTPRAFSLSFSPSAA